MTQIVVKHRESLIEALEVAAARRREHRRAPSTPSAKTLDIRNNNHQANDPYSIVVCQVLAPILDITCPPEPASAVPADAGERRPPKAAPRGDAEAERLTDRLSPLLLMGSAS